MAITTNDIKFKLPKAVNDLASNGGRISNNNTDNKVFPFVSGAERVAGITRYRKLFFKNEQKTVGNLVDLTLYDAKVYMETISPGDDYYRLIHNSGAHATDVQDDIDGLTAWAGVGILNVDVVGPETNFDIDCEHASGFEDASVICIAYKDTNGTVHREIVDLTSKTWNGLTASLVTAGITNSYERAYDTKTATIFSETTIGAATATYVTSPQEHVGRLVRIKSGTGVGQVRRIASHTTTTLTVTYKWTTTPDGTSVYEILKTYVSQVVELGDLVAASSDWLETNTHGGTYDEATYPLQLFPVGCVDQDWTLTFTSDGPDYTYSVAGDELGTILTGQVKASDCAPANGTSFYFKLLAAGFSGTDTWRTGDKIEFTTKGSCAGFWLKQVVPAGANSCADNLWNFAYLGDSA